MIPLIESRKVHFEKSVEVRPLKELFLLNFYTKSQGARTTQSKSPDGCKFIFPKYYKDWLYTLQCSPELSLDQLFARSANADTCWANLSKNYKNTIFIWVFIVLGIWNFGRLIEVANAIAREFLRALKKSPVYS